MATQDLDITSIGVASGSALVRDLKGSITTWTKDGTATGHFNVANSEVVPGCAVTFADASTATIVGKSGDGTGASSIILSADHATDAALASITGLIYAAPNVQPNQAWGAATQTWSGSPASDSGGVANYALRQIHSAANISTSGTQVRVTLLAAGSAHSIFAHVCFAEHAGSGNAAGAFGGSKFKEFLFGGSAGVDIPNGGSATSDWLDFTVDETLSYMTVMSYTAAANVCRYSASGSDGIYYKGASAGDYNLQNISGYAFNNAGLYHVTKVEVRNVVTPTAMLALHTNASQIATQAGFTLTAVTATQTLASGAAAYHAVSFNKGSGTEKWWVYVSSAWRSIVELTSGTWQYRDAGGTLQNATVNSRLGALAQAFAIAQNQMAKAALEAITAVQWAGIVSSGTLDFACGLQASGVNLPQLDKWTINYTSGLAYAIGGTGWVPGVSAFGV